MLRPRFWCHSTPLVLLHSIPACVCFKLIAFIPFWLRLSQIDCVYFSLIELMPRSRLRRWSGQKFWNGFGPNLFSFWCWSRCDGPFVLVMDSNHLNGTKKILEWIFFLKLFRIENKCSPVQGFWILFKNLGKKFLEWIFFLKLFRIEK